MVSIWILIVIIISSAVIFYLERGDWNADTRTWVRLDSNGNEVPSQFQSIIHSFWWSVSTITTTGYGDAIPVTPWGKFTGGITMLLGILVIAIPTSILGSNYIDEWTLYRRIKSQIRLRRVREQADAMMRQFHGKKEKRIEILQINTNTMLEVVTEVQNKLAELNPPRYWKKYKQLRAEYDSALEHIRDLQAKLDEQKRINRNLSRFNNQFKSTRSKIAHAKDPSELSTVRGWDGYQDNETEIQMPSENNSVFTFKSLPLSKYATTTNLSDDTRKVAKVGRFPLKALDKLRKTFSHKSQDEPNYSIPVQIETISSPIDLDLRWRPPVTNQESDPPDTYLSPKAEDNFQSVMTLPGTAREMLMARMIGGNFTRLEKPVHLSNLWNIRAKNGNNNNNIQNQKDREGLDLEKGKTIAQPDAFMVVVDQDSRLSTTDSPQMFTGNTASQTMTTLPSGLRQTAQGSTSVVPHSATQTLNDEEFVQEHRLDEECDVNDQVLRTKSSRGNLIFEEPALIQRKKIE